MTDDRWIWIAKWDEFQHYKPERDQGPAWIKDYTKQLRDQRYLDLTDRQRALLSDIRRIFAVTFPWLPRDTAVVSRHRHRQTFRSDLDALNNAGFIEFHSRASLEITLEHFMDKRKSKSKEKEIPLTPPEAGMGDERLNPRALGTNPRAVADRAKRDAGIRDFVHRVWDEYPEDILRVELADKGLRADEVEDLIASERRSRIAVVPDVDVA